MNLQELGGRLGLTIQGEADYPIHGVRDIERLSAEDALEPNFLYFVESPAVLKRHPKAAEQGAVLTIPRLAERFKNALIAPEESIRLSFIKLLKHYDKTPVFPAGVDPRAVVHPGAKVAASAVVLAGAVVMEGAVVGERCVLYPNVVLEPFASLGDDTTLYPGVVIGHHCTIGKRCILHGGTVIGADGFGFYDKAGSRHKIPQIGNVDIADDVEIGASCTVDRATIETTRIGVQTKLDDQVHVGHNCQIGRFVYLVGNTAIGGSVVIEDGAMISGMVIVKDHLRVGKGAIVMGMSGVAQDCEAGGIYFGTPARPAHQMHKMHSALERLPELLVRFRDLEAKVNGVPAAD